jgi:hypothetical protein
MGARGFWRESKVDFITLLADAYKGAADGAIRPALENEAKSK